MVSIRRAGKVFVISDFLMLLNSVERGAGIVHRRQHGRDSGADSRRDRTRRPGPEGDVEVVDAESGERVRVSIGQRERERYRETLMRLAREIKVFCSRAGCVTRSTPPITVSTISSCARPRDLGWCIRPRAEAFDAMGCWIRARSIFSRSCRR